MAHFQMSTGGSKSNEHVDHFLVDIHRSAKRPHLLHFGERSLKEAESTESRAKIGIICAKMAIIKIIVAQLAINERTGFQEIYRNIA